ncbi:hypothetical protein [Spiroplasma sp. ald]|uniref:hypothetical protein n=1 Tax=Spiroplasma sp. ald TaxID=2490849 RepID=UPI0037DDAD4E
MMINFLSEQVSSDPWSNVFSFVIGCFMDIFDLIMYIKLPLTNVSLFYILIFTMIVELSIYAIHGTSTNYNQLGSSVKNQVSNLYGGNIKGSIRGSDDKYVSKNKKGKFGDK